MSERVIVAAWCFATLLLAINHRVVRFAVLVALIIAALSPTVKRSNSLRGFFGVVLFCSGIISGIVREDISPWIRGVCALNLTAFVLADHLHQP